MVRAIRLSLEAVDPGLEQAARTLGAGALDRLRRRSRCRWRARGSWSAAIVGYATCLGEFGAVITFAANIPGETQTLPLAIYAALQSPAARPWRPGCRGVSMALALAGLLLAEWLGRRLRAAVGR